MTSDVEIAKPMLNDIAKIQGATIAKYRSVINPDGQHVVTAFGADEFGNAWHHTLSWPGSK